MRSIVIVSLGLILASPITAQAQVASSKPLIPGAPVQTQTGTGRSGSASATLLETPGAAPSAPSGFDPPGQKPPRPDTAIGPDLVAYIFAPVGKIVGPITEGLHVFDASLAPINAVLLPLTGPHDPAPEVAPASAPVSPVAEAVPTTRGPRK